MADLPSPSQLSALMRHRRSIKPVDLDAARGVERALLTQILEDATWAPTHGLTEPWKFIVHQGAARQRLAETMQRVYRDTTPAHEFREDKMKKMSENPLLAPVIIACVMERRGGAKIPEIEEIEAVACALQNLQLSATAAGLGCYWSSPPLLGTREFADWLGIGSEDKCVGLIYLGWPRAGLNWPRSVRQPVETKTLWRDD
ncbi:nitroreductase family protein [Prosthecobacter vanneervenii]|uniref:Putative NAD(P)H nitroreductase n=1 Tax=Prosthecobacter vanneervenii TaxID=48466 RepID=A0A7W7YEB0_9BACT|nr:nitroreductase [Prosthecobacter vanneervenii]MBB5034606.1 nitroreductase [Prosthecobacter vanneervenii]